MINVCNTQVPCKVSVPAAVLPITICGVYSAGSVVFLRTGTGHPAVPLRDLFLPARDGS